MEDKNVERREKNQTQKDVKVKEVIAYKSVFLHLNT